MRQFGVTYLVSFGAGGPLFSWVTLGWNNGGVDNTIQMELHRSITETHRGAVSAWHSWQTWFSCGPLQEVRMALMTLCMFYAWKSNS